MSKSVIIFLIFIFFVAAPQSFSARVDVKTYQKRLKESALKETLNQFEAEPFHVFVDEAITPSLERDIRRIIQEAVSSLTSEFHYHPEGAMQVLLIQASSYLEIGPDTLSSGFYQDKKIRIAWPQNKTEEELLRYFKKVFRHELTHLILSQMTGNKIPRWLNEGLAVYAEQDGTRGGYGEGRTFYERMVRENKEDRLGEKFFERNLTLQYSQDTQDFYDQSYLLAKSLIHTCSMNSVREMFEQMKAGSSFTEALKIQCRLTQNELATKTYQN